MATPTTDQHFLAEVEGMIDARGEVLVEFRYSRAAGNRDIALFHSFLSFQEHLATLSPPTLVELYRNYDLPLRGVIDGALIQAASALLGEAEYLIVYLQPRNDWRRADRYDQEGGWLGSFHNDEGQEKLEEKLRDTLGEQAAVGAYPDWREASGNLLWAVVPNADGSLQVGVY